MSPKIGNFDFLGYLGEIESDSQTVLDPHMHYMPYFVPRTVQWLTRFDF